MKTLYICYFSLREPLVQTQVLPYLRELSKSGIEIYLLTFDPKDEKGFSADEIEEQRLRLQAEDIRWFSLAYHKRPSVAATLYDIVAGARLAVKLVRQHKIDVLHARAHVPMAMALLVKRWINCRLVFDVRGLMAEEYAEAGIWNENSFAFRAVKGVEQAGLREADQIVVLTRRMRDWLVNQQSKAAEQIEVIPCCVDFSRFAENECESALSPASRFEVVYAGSVTGLYLLEEMARFFLQIRARQSGALLRILTASPPAEVSSRLISAGLSADDFVVGYVSPEKIFGSLRNAKLGLSFRKPSFGQIAASPTKIPEYLAAGLPIVCTAGVGDTDQLLEWERVGVVLNAFDDAAYALAAEKTLVLLDESDLAARCVTVAHRCFDLVQVGGRGYSNVYRRLEAERDLNRSISALSQ
jgi:glycosyltransferase involved in cell wall biosynthesis